MQGNTTEEIKSRLPIDTVVGSYITLIERGKYLCAVCPFHSEKSPSFYVSPDRGTYYCFGCGEKGDIFSFVEKYEGLDFRGALKELAQKAGVSLNNTNQTVSSSKKETLYSVLEQATKYFIENLNSNDNALKYLNSRKLNDTTIKKFKIGFSLNNWDGVSLHLKNLGFKDQEIIDAGLGIVGKSGLYDRFRGRIMFPIEDTAGRVIAFSARILPELDDGKSGKYINSPETELYHKSSVLYGLSLAKQSIKKYNFSILVEGQFDVVLSHQFGFTNTIAVSGTAFSGKEHDKDEHLTQLGLISRLSKNIILALDNDPAGQKAQVRILEEAIPIGFSIKIVPSDTNEKDPADILSSENGVEHWKSLIKKALPPTEFFCIQILNKNISRDKQISELKNTIYPYVLNMPSSVDKYESAKIIEKYFSLPVEYIMNDINTNTKTKLNTESREINESELVEVKIEPSNTKELFYGLLYASTSPKSPIYEYRNLLLEFLNKISKNIVEDDQKQIENQKETLALEAEINYEKSSKKQAFIDEVMLAYEEMIFYDMLLIIKDKFRFKTDNPELISEYNKIQKDLEIIKQKRRNI